MTNGLIIGKFFPSHLGHKYLIDFADSYGCFHTDVIVFGMAREKIPTSVRFDALHKHYLYNNNVQIHYHEEDLPQYPEEHPDFWNIWKDRITKKVKVDSNTIIFASENYGIKLAETLGCKFVPVDIDRETYPMSGTIVREDVRNNFNYLLPEMKPYLARKIVVFGSDSVGKTTFSKDFAIYMGGKFVPEYARTYLNMFPSETITGNIMNDISEGQLAVQEVDHYNPEKYLTVFDTDFLTTFGYWKLFGLHDENIEKYIIHHMRYSQNYHYLVLDTNIPFEIDVQRYGIDKRQSNTQFWIDILEKFKKPYSLITESDRRKRIIQAIDSLG